jgi:hypothetical protein
VATACCLALLIWSSPGDDAVLEAALGSSSLSKEAYVSSMLSLPCSLTPGGIGHISLLKPIGSPTFNSYSKTLVLEARLLRDFAGAKAGDSQGHTGPVWQQSCNRRGYNFFSRQLRVVYGRGEHLVASTAAAGSHIP